MSGEGELQLVIDLSSSLIKLLFKVLLEIFFELRRISLPVISQSRRNFLLFVGNSESLPLAQRKWLYFFKPNLHWAVGIRHRLIIVDKRHFATIESFKVFHKLESALRS
jgi:hypothetical protein